MSFSLGPRPAGGISLVAVFDLRMEFPAHRRRAHRLRCLMFDVEGDHGWASKFRERSLAREAPRVTETARRRPSAAFRLRWERCGLGSQLDHVWNLTAKSRPPARRHRDGIEGCVRLRLRASTASWAVTFRAVARCFVP